MGCVSFGVSLVVAGGAGGFVEESMYQGLTGGFEDVNKFNTKVIVENTIKESFFGWGGKFIKIPRLTKGPNNYGMVYTAKETGIRNKTVSVWNVSPKTGAKGIAAGVTKESPKSVFEGIGGIEGLKKAIQRLKERIQKLRKQRK